MDLKNLCINGKFKITPHINSMEQLQIRAEKFRKQGRLWDEDLEKIIKEIKANEDINDKERNGKATIEANDEHHKVLEAEEEGLLQVHGVGKRGTNQLRLVEQYLDVLVKHTTEIPPPTALVEVHPQLP
jgi:hypothetical protein